MIDTKIARSILDNNIGHMNFDDYRKLVDVINELEEYHRILKSNHIKSNVELEYRLYCSCNSKYDMK